MPMRSCRTRCSMRPRRWPEEAFLAVAESSFAFLDLVTTADGVFWPIGNRDWYSHGEEKSLYDQQPVEAATMADAALAALELRGDDKYLAIFLARARLVPRPQQPGRIAGRCASRGRALTASSRRELIAIKAPNRHSRICGPSCIALARARARERLYAKSAIVSG